MSGRQRMAKIIYAMLGAFGVLLTTSVLSACSSTSVSASGFHGPATANLTVQIDTIHCTPPQNGSENCSFTGSVALSNVTLTTKTVIFKVVSTSGTPLTGSKSAGNCSQSSCNYASVQFSNHSPIACGFGPLFFQTFVVEDGTRPPTDTGATTTMTPLRFFVRGC